MTPPTHNPSPQGPMTQSERLWVPVSWWLLSLGFAATLVVALAAYTNLWFGAAVAVLSLVVIGSVFGGYGGARVRADETGITAGRAHVGWEWVRDVQHLDEAASAAAMGPGAMATGYLVLRPYLKQSLRVELSDPADPHPFWLVSSRHAARLAQVAQAHLGATRPDSVPDADLEQAR